MAVQLVRRRFTVDEYYQMMRAGILHEGDRVELIEGEIVEMAAIGSRHAASVARLMRLFIEVFKDQAFVNVQNPFHLSHYSEPQPDLIVARPRADYYANAHPTPEDIFLVIEVADSTLKYDRDVKIPLYAQQGVRETWLVNLQKGWIEVYRKPSIRGYQEVRRCKRGEYLSPEAFPDVVLAVDDILGRGHSC